MEALLDAYAAILDKGGLAAPGDTLPTAEAAPRIWFWSPGEGAAHWNELYERGLMAVGWDALGDLRQYATPTAMLEALAEAYPRDGQPSNDARACYDFAHAIRPGDIVFAKRGRGTIVGHGEVVGDYAYDPSRAALQNVRAVR
ncbi:hypothetical protein CR165_22080 [Pseudoroseomonas aestuarii]|uniref:Uncharacterized protein n=1 Tax=Teichococcus aestuarii TaxID=568898 RepID=A0A2U1UYA8_9PROT|nr:hypothetical protein CR165_22080 [Pseudoroseomonas aestuarii]